MDSPLDSDDDEISLVFTPQSPARERYSIDNILAEQIRDTLTEDGHCIAVTHYLVQWEGYDWTRNSWEPEPALMEDAAETIRLWKRHRLRELAGCVEPFDLAKWTKDWEHERDRNIQRREKRNRRRKRRGMPVWPEPFTGETYEPPPNLSDQSIANDSEDDGMFVTVKDENIDSDYEDDDQPLSLNRAARNKRSSGGQDDRGTTQHVKLARARQRSGSETSDDVALFVKRKRRKLAAGGPGETVAVQAALSKSQSAAEGIQSPAAAAAPSHGSTTLSGAIPAKTLIKPTSPTSPEEPKGSISRKASTHSRDRTKTVRPKAYNTLQLVHRANKQKDIAPLQEPEELRALEDGALVVRKLSSEMPRQTIQQQTDGRGGKVPNDKPSTTHTELECWYWREDIPHPDYPCPFVHRTTGYRAGPRNSLKKEQGTCWYWYSKGQCKKSDGECRWSHGITRYLARQDGSLTKFDPHSLPRKHSVAEAVPQKSTAERPKFLKMVPSATIDLWDQIMGCYFKNVEGFCHRSKGCKFSHAPVDWASGPPNNKDQVYWVGGVSNCSYEDALAQRERSKHSIVDATSNTAEVARSPGLTENAQDKNLDRLQTECLDVAKTPTAESTPNSESTGLSLGLSIRVPSEQNNLQLQAHLVGLSREMGAALLDEDDSPVEVLETSEMVVADALSQLPKISYKVHRVDDVLITKHEKTSTIWSLLEAAKAALIFHRARANILLFPKLSNPSCWQFIDNDPSTKGNLFRYAIISSLRNTIQNPEQTRTSDDVNVQDLAMDLKPLRKYQDILLVFPSHLQGEERSMGHALQQNGSRVYSIHKDGTWKIFAKHEATCAIIFHGSFQDFRSLPDLGKLLCERDQMAFFRLSGEETQITAQTATGPQAPRLVPIFPSGRVVMFLDDCFDSEKFPDQALKAVRFLEDRISGHASGHLFCKIIGRPQLLDWLEDRSIEENVALAKYAESGSIVPQDTPVSDMRRALYEISQSTENLITPPEFELPSYNETFESDSREASIQLLDWFNGWILENVGYYRRFIVVTFAGHKQKLEWRSKFRQMEFLTPFEYVELEEKLERRKKRYEERRKEKLRLQTVKGSSVFGAGPSGESPITPIEIPAQLQTPRSPDAEKEPMARKLNQPVRTEPTRDPRLLRQLRK